MTEPEPVDILLVDDNPGNLEAMAALLNAPGFNPVTTDSGKAALRCLLKQEFAVILLDVQMPEMDGFETATLIRKRESTRQTPIIFITGFEKSAEYLAKGYALGAVDYILKPIEPSFLKTKVSVFVELHRKTAQEKMARERLEEMTEALARSNKELEQFAYVASQDLQEPLRKIKNFTEILAKRYQGRLDEKADEFIYYITDGADRMQRLITGRV